MEAFILKSMTDFVLEQNEKLRKDIHDNYNKLLIPQCCDRIFNYANFLKKPLKLGYFIPCDENDVPLEEPKHYDLWKKHGSFTQYGESIVYKCNKFYESKQRVLFEGFEYDGLYIEYKINNLNRFFKDELRKGTIEDLLVQIDDKIKLTETAKKEIGIE